MGPSGVEFGCCEPVMIMARGLIATLCKVAPKPWMIGGWGGGGTICVWPHQAPRVFAASRKVFPTPRNLAFPNPRCEHVRLRKKQKLLHVLNCLLGPASVLFTVVAAVGCNGNGCKLGRLARSCGV